MILEPWETLLLAWLHDPVDKAADIRGHFSRAQRYAAAILDREVTDSELRGGLADQLASAYERLPMPDARGRYDELGVAPLNGRLTIFHPLTGRGKIPVFNQIRNWFYAEVRTSGSGIE